MTTLVNIGLQRNDVGLLRPEHALAALRAIGGAQVIASRVHVSDTEPTLVAELARPLNAAAAYEVSRFLHQDAIAQFDGWEGQLIGPRAEAWGAFDGHHFLTLSGDRLA
jgi:hypothetical protein